MSKKSKLFAWTCILVVLAAAAAGWFFSGTSGSETQRYLTATAVRQELRETVETNGTIEPLQRSEIFSPLSGFVAVLQVSEGQRVEKGEILMRLESEQLKSSLAEARVALLQARSQAHTVLSGPSKEELNGVESSIEETRLQLSQQEKELEKQEALLNRQATTRAEVENLREQLKLLGVRLANLQQKKQDILSRYTPQEKEWQQKRVRELENQVEILERQLEETTVRSPWRGTVYSLAVLPGAYVNTGQTLARIFEPGQVRLKAYVDEPDLGRVKVGQDVLIQWDALPDRTWQGTVARRAEEVVRLGSRSVGNVICSIKGSPAELIPNINVNVRIIVASKSDALVIPRSAVFSRDDKPTVMRLEDGKPVYAEVTLGLVTAQKVEVLKGISEGDRVVVNPEMGAPQ